MRLLPLLTVCLALTIAADRGVARERSLSGEPLYTQSAPSRDGIGKRYMGREIARVMGHRGAGWLERPSRSHEELPERVIDAMQLAPRAVVADVGAGTGYFTLRIAQRIAHGQVYAVDIQAEMLDIIRQRARRLSLANITPVQARPDDPLLAPESVDAVLLVDAYHEFSHPHEMMQALVAALRPGGRLYLVEYRGEDARLAVKPLHKMTQRQAKLEMLAAGLHWLETLDFLPTQHFMVFEKSPGHPAGQGRAPGASPAGQSTGALGE